MKKNIKKIRGTKEKIFEVNINLRKPYNSIDSETSKTCVNFLKINLGKHAYV